MDAWEVAAREGVRDTMARYNHAGDRGRAAELAACFTEDGVLDVGGHGGRWVGRAAIRTQIEAVVTRLAGGGDVDDDHADREGEEVARERPAPLHHHVSSVLIDIASASEATAASYFLVLGGDGPDHWGRYRDRFRQEDGRWLLAERVVRVDGRAAGSRVGRG